MIATPSRRISKSAIPVMRPQLPTADQLLPYLRRIDEARYYSNHGALLREFERRMSGHFGVGEAQLAVVSNGTTALSAALVASGAKPGKRCLLPAWTFVASAAAVWAANLTPYFVDVAQQTWMLDPERIKRRSDLADVGAVMVVSPFGAPVDTSAWDLFTAETGIPVIIDGAAAFDTVATIREARPGRSPIMISLHATKSFGTGEGSIILSTDEMLVHRLRQICNFGVWGAPEGQILGYNGKLSEYHAAIGLAMLDQWSDRRAKFATLTAKYVRSVGSIPNVRLSPNYGSGWISCYCNVEVDGSEQTIIERLQSRGIETRRWWQSGVHMQRAYRDLPRDPVPITDELAKRVFGLPFFHDLTDEQLATVSNGLKDAVEETA